MKRYILIITLISMIGTGVRIGAAESQAPPRPEGVAVADLAGILSPEAREWLNDLSIRMEQQTHFSLVWLTIEQLPQDRTIEDYSTRVYETWGIGGKGKDHGLLVVIAAKDREMRLEAGYGAEGYLPDAVCKRIIEQVMVPAFKQGDYDSGTMGAAIEITKRVAEEFHVDAGSLIPQGNTAHRRPSQQKPREISLFQAILGLIIFVVLVSTPFGRQLLLLMLISGRSGRGNGGGGGFGGGFGGGGFGGFGGGSSGGGGASGRW